MVDATVEEAKQAAGGYLKVDIQKIDSSAAINIHLRSRGRELE